MLAGALAGGIAITFEKKNRRLGVAQQMFVRGLQGSWNAYSTRRGFSFPHGDVAVFSLRLVFLIRIESTFFDFLLLVALILCTRTCSHLIAWTGDITTGFNKLRISPLRLFSSIAV